MLTVASKHFGQVACYAADAESGLIRSKVGKNFYAKKKIPPFVLNRPQHSARFLLNK